MNHLATALFYRNMDFSAEQLDDDAVAGVKCESKEWVEYIKIGLYYRNDLTEFCLFRFQGPIGS